jgi:hypothetical protein
MAIHHKIIIALLMSVLLVETDALLGNQSLRHFLIAIVYAGVIFVGSYYFVSVLDRFAYDKKIEHHDKSLETENSENQKQKSQQPHNGLKIVR